MSRHQRKKKQVTKKDNRVPSCPVDSSTALDCHRRPDREKAQGARSETRPRPRGAGAGGSKSRAGGAEPRFSSSDAAGTQCHARPRDEGPARRRRARPKPCVPSRSRPSRGAPRRRPAQSADIHVRGPDRRLASIAHCSGTLRLRGRLLRAMYYVPRGISSRASQGCLCDTYSPPKRWEEW